MKPLKETKEKKYFQYGFGNEFQKLEIMDYKTLMNALAFIEREKENIISIVITGEVKSE